MTKFQRRFSAADVEVQASEWAYRGFFGLRKVTLRHRLFGGGWSETFTREIFERGDAVAVLPWDPVRDEIIFVEQFRVGAIRHNDSPWMLELVAGIVEPGESDGDVVHREAVEEAGCTLDRIEPIATFYPSAGACTEQIRLFVGRVTHAGVNEVHGLASEHEDLLVHAISRQQAIALMDNNEINNGHTLIALQWLARHGDKLAQAWLS